MLMLILMELLDYTSANTATVLLHCESIKQDTKLLSITSPILTDFQTFFTDGLGSKFATNSCLNIPLCLKRAATLHCEI